MTRPGIEPRSPGPLANTLPNRPMERLITASTKSIKKNRTIIRKQKWEEKQTGEILQEKTPT